MTAPARASGRIELRLRALDQLFDSFDPAPFHEKDLDRDAEEFIVSWAREYPPDTPLVFRLHLPADQRPLEPQQTVATAMHNYFAYRSDLARLEVRRTLQQGRTSLLVGLLFLGTCMAARALLHQLTAVEWMRVVDEGLLIIGWVAMWRPVELLLYDWWPQLRRKRTFDNLGRMQVEVLFDSGHGEANRS
ncbi:MAG: hypothetical protein KF830_16020 [Planctomycetes bacterium]|nr:hypothetical protein [Planctomycetota bacterium]